MREQREPLYAAYQPTSTARSLARLADALGVPVASFYGPMPQGDPGADLIIPEEAALLALVERHMLRVDPEARQRFTQAVQRMAGSVI